MRVVLILTALLFAACSGGEKPVIAVAANFKQPLAALWKSFSGKTHSNDIHIISASSGKLATQVMLGAEYDLFLSADEKYPRQLLKKSLTRGIPAQYAEGRLVLFIPAGLYSKKGMNNISSEFRDKIVIANPALAPYGRAAVDVLTASGFKGLKQRLVYAPNVHLTYMYIIKAARAGFVARSLFFRNKKSAPYREAVHWMNVAPALHSPIYQAMVLLKAGKFPEKIRAFYNFILSESGKEIIRSFGYICP